MKYFLSAITIFFTLFSISHDSMAASTKDQIAEIVRTMGYGGAIHNFKNYVLRGADKYNGRSVSGFGKVLSLVDNIRNKGGLNDKEKAALNGITKVATAYKDAVATVKNAHGAGKTVKEVDKSVKISDKPANEGIALLRGKFQWSKLEDLEYTLGYGKGIHLFKNYVIRGAAKYHDKTDNAYANALTIISDMRKEGANGSALDGVETVVKAYKNALSSIQKMIAGGKTAEEIDKAVKISDKPATTGLAALRGK